MGLLETLKRRLGKGDAVPVEINEKDLKSIPDCLRQEENLSLDDEKFMTLLHAIESGFCELCKTGELKTDAQVGAALEWLSRNCVADPGGDLVLLQVQTHLRIFLNINHGHYSRGDVRRACNKIRRSVDRHRDAMKDDAYLRFILEYVR